MEGISRLDLTISAMCQRRASLHTQVVVAQLCMYAILAAHSQAGSIVMQGRTASTAENLAQTPSPRLRPSDQRAKRTRSPLQVNGPMKGGMDAAANNLGAAPSPIAAPLHNAPAYGDELIQELAELVANGSKPTQRRGKRRKRESPFSVPSTQPYQPAVAVAEASFVDDENLISDRNMVAQAATRHVARAQAHLSDPSTTPTTQLEEAIAAIAARFSTQIRIDVAHVSQPAENHCHSYSWCPIGAMLRVGHRLM